MSREKAIRVRPPAQVNVRGRVEDKQAVDDLALGSGEGQARVGYMVAMMARALSAKGPRDV